jgi:hypothetical protein
MFGKAETCLAVDIEGGMGSGLTQFLDLVIELRDGRDPAWVADVNQVTDRGQVGLML